MSILNESYTLNNGIKIPKIGFGTWQIPQDVAERAVADALSAGYRHIDTALAYNNEAGVGNAIRESALDRGDIFVTSKLLERFFKIFCYLHLKLTNVKVRRKGVP